MTTTLTAMLDETLASALAGAGSVRTHLESARAALAHDLTVVVTGRRGVGKSTALNAMLAEPVVEVGYSAEDRPVQIVGSDEEAAVPWAVATRVPTTLARGRRYVELPEHLSCVDSDGVRRVAGLAPDVLVHVTRHRLRSDETELLRRAQSEWRIQPLEVLVVGTQAGRPGTATALEELPDRLGASARLVEARRCGDVMHELPIIAARSDEPAWAGRLLDDLEQLSLTAPAHALRERWALEACLSRPADIPTELREDLLRLTLGEPRGTRDDSAPLRGRATHWLAQLPLMPPLTAEVARVVTRTIQLRVGTPAVHQSARGDQR